MESTTSQPTHKLMSAKKKTAKPAKAKKASKAKKAAKKPKAKKATKKAKAKTAAEFDPTSLFRSIERSNRAPSQDVEFQAQELFYDAMEADNFDEHLNLLMQALELDPTNVDATLALMQVAGPFPTEERVNLLGQLVEMAADQLGKACFKENKGHFWGLFETRPYMRARAALADAWLEAGNPAQAQAEWLAMLELNPGDNQGLRYPLLATCLVLEDLRCARSLIKRYPDEAEFNTVFAWARVLLAHMEGKLEKAEALATDAHEQNPHSKAYLLGHRKIPKKLPPHYGVGSEEEAISFAQDLQRAWKAYPDALRWLEGLKLGT